MKGKLISLAVAAALPALAPVEPSYYRSLPSRKRHSVFPRQKIDKRARRRSGKP